MSTIDALARDYVLESYKQGDETVSMAAFLAEAELGPEYAWSAYMALAAACVSQRPRCETCDDEHIISTRVGYQRRTETCHECHGESRDRITVVEDVAIVTQDPAACRWWIVVVDSVGPSIVGTMDHCNVEVRRQVKAGRRVVGAFETLDEARAAWSDEKRICAGCARGRGAYACPKCQEERLGAELVASLARVA